MSADHAGVGIPLLISFIAYGLCPCYKKYKARKIAEKGAKGDEEEQRRPGDGAEAKFLSNPDGSGHIQMETAHSSPTPRPGPDLKQM